MSVATCEGTFFWENKKVPENRSKNLCTWRERVREKRESLESRKNAEVMQTHKTKRKLVMYANIQNSSK